MTPVCERSLLWLLSSSELLTSCCDSRASTLCLAAARLERLLVPLDLLSLLEQQFVGLVVRGGGGSWTG